MRGADTTTRLPPAYWRLWTASAVSNLGDGMFMVALPLLAARLTDDRVAVGLIATFFTIPWLLFAIPAGVFVDRSDRRRVMVTADTFRALLVGGLAVLAAWSHVEIWMLWVLAFGLGTGEVFFDGASQTILPTVVSGEQLERANGFFYAAETVTNAFLGLPLGSALFGFVVWLPFGIDAASFVAAAVLAATLPGRFRPQQRTADADAESMIAGIRVGLRWLVDHVLLRDLALAAALGNLAFGATQATLVLFAREQLGLGERMFGPFVALIGVGSVIGGVFGGHVVARVGRRAAALTMGAVPVVCCLLIGTFPTAWAVAALYAVQALTSTVFTVVTVSLRQQIVPDHVLGRVNSLYRWMGAGAMALGALFGSMLADVFTLQTPYFAAAALLALADLMMLVRFTNPAIESALVAQTGAAS